MRVNFKKLAITFKKQTLSESTPNLRVFIWTMRRQGKLSKNMHPNHFERINMNFNISYKISLKDSANERYKKLKKSIQLFSAIQIGLSTFRYCNEQKAFISDSYNFYLFPRNYGLSADLINSFQTSSVEFLCKYEFDFNKVDAFLKFSQKNCDLFILFFLNKS